MMRKLIVFVVLIGVVLCPYALADQITLKNGDRLTGTIVRLDEDGLILRSEFAGEVKIQWAAVESVTSNEPLYVTSRDGRVHIGTVVTTPEGMIEVQTKDGARVTLAKDAVQVIRSQAAQSAYEAELQRQREAHWAGSLDAGFSLTSGNAETTVISLGTQAARTTQRDRLGLYAAALFARNSTTGVSITTAEAIRGGARYDRDLNPRLFAFALTDLERDRFQQLDLRLVLGGGLGYHAIKSERTRLDLFAGASFNQENFSTAPTRRSAELLFGEELTHQLSSRVSFAERLMFYPNLSDTGEYRLTFDSAAVMRLTERMSVQVTVSDRYLSNPLPGLKKNDLLLTTGVRLTFGGRGEKK
jgi:putative salt-induced outer membrane protein YdiY